MISFEALWALRHHVWMKYKRSIRGGVCHHELYDLVEDLDEVIDEVANGMKPIDAFMKIWTIRGLN